MNAAQSLAQSIISTAVNNRSLLCWDGSNGKEDLLANIHSYVSRFTGYKLMRVTFEGGVLKIEALKQRWPHQVYDSMLPPPEPVDDIEHLLSYDVVTGREVYGRCRHVGFYGQHYDELKALVTAH
jgi:hypothetical protein